MVSNGMQSLVAIEAAKLEAFDGINSFVMRLSLSLDLL